MIIYFDTETTGLRPGQICQLSYIMQNETGVRGKNFYFSVDYVEPSATAVNGLTAPLLLQLSNGRVFADDAIEIADDFASASLVIAHNIAFDHKFMVTELERAGYYYTPHEELCSMRFFTNKLRLPGRMRGFKYPSLAELATHFCITDEDTDSLATRYFGGSNGAHDARHDTIKLFLAFNEGRNEYADIEKIIIENL